MIVCEQRSPHGFQEDHGALHPSIGDQQPHNLPHPYILHEFHVFPYHGKFQAPNDHHVLHGHHDRLPHLSDHRDHHGRLHAHGDDVHVHLASSKRPC